MAQNKQRRILLLGDSTFDNTSYTGGKPSVADYLQQFLPDDSIGLLAVDGHRIKDVYDQLKSIPEHATHLILSVGGNDVLEFQPYLDRPAETVEGVLTDLYNFRLGFEKDYGALIEMLLSFNLPLTICTIYTGWFGNEPTQKKVNAALCVFNDVIYRIGFVHGLLVLDLREICYEETHFTQTIEPSAEGGRRIAMVLAQSI